MTMTTRVAIVDPILPAKVHEAITRIVGGSGEAMTYRAVDSFGNQTIGNEAGQGLDALVWVKWHPDGPYARDEEDTGPLCALEVGIDTPYGGSEGQPQILASFGAWLDEQGVRWMWHDEWHDIWHDSTVRMEDAR